MSLSYREFAATGVLQQPVDEQDAIRRAVAILPRPLRFLGVGAIGLVCDLGIFTLLITHGLHPLFARAVSLALATIVTWRLNRALTFDVSGRRTADEGLRYAAVAAGAQGLSYVLFALLILIGFGARPQLALLIGAGTAALFSYYGQARFAFTRHETLAAARRSA